MTRPAGGKPLGCPFCGKQPEVGPADPKADGDAWAYVSCVNTKCPTGLSGEGVTVRHYGNGPPAKMRAAAIKKWNTRSAEAIRRAPR